jgi:hypothetical protein
MDSFGGVTIANCKYIISLVVLFFLARARHDDILHSCCKSLSLSPFDTLFSGEWRQNAAGPGLSICRGFHNTARVSSFLVPWGPFVTHGNQVFNRLHHDALAAVSLSEGPYVIPAATPPPLLM